MALSDRCAAAQMSCLLVCRGMAGMCGLTVRAGRDMGAIGAEHARKAEVGQLADVAARVFLRGLGALD